MPHKNQTKLIADVMVGKLARYLRMAGYDVAYINDADDDLIIQIAKKQGRVVLTRDTMMLERREFKNGILRSVFIMDDSLRDQLLQVKNELELILEPNLVLCPVCNNLLKDMEKKSVKNKVPPYVYKTRDNFKYCSNCGRYYWRGSHYDYIKKYFNKLNNKLKKE
jgi:uncharacterized protein